MSNARIAPIGFRQRHAPLGGALAAAPVLPLGPGHLATIPTLASVAARPAAPAAQNPSASWAGSDAQALATARAEAQQAIAQLAARHADPVGPAQQLRSMPAPPPAPPPPPRPAAPPPLPPAPPPPPPAPPMLPPPPAPTGLPPVAPAAPPAPPSPAPATDDDPPAAREGQGPLSRHGAVGEPVKQLQDRLKALGFDAGPLDGIFGPRTEAAVKAFQAARGLKVDGIVGPDTWAALGIKAEGSVRYAAPGHPGADSDDVHHVGNVPLVTRQGFKMHANIAADFDRMVAAARADGVSLRINSGHRSVEHQRRLWNEAVAKYGERGARKWVAPPGRSNHQAGNALDIANAGGAHAWLRRNGARFGFSQPMSWEPWHWEHRI